jgi:hypothetical protein
MRTRIVYFGIIVGVLVGAWLLLARSERSTVGHVPKFEEWKPVP